MTAANRRRQVQVRRDGFHSSYEQVSSGAVSPGGFKAELGTHVVHELKATVF